MKWRNTKSTEYSSWSGTVRKWITLSNDLVAMNFAGARNQQSTMKLLMIVLTSSPDHILIGHGRCGLVPGIDNMENKKVVWIFLCTLVSSFSSLLFGSQPSINHIYMGFTIFSVQLIGSVCTNLCKDNHIGPISYEASRLVWPNTVINVNYLGTVRCIMNVLCPERKTMWWCGQANVVEGRM